MKKKFGCDFFYKLIQRFKGLMLAQPSANASHQSTAVFVE